MVRIHIIYNQNNPKQHKCTLCESEVYKLKEQLTKQESTKNEWKHLSFQVLPWKGYFIEK